MDKGTGSCQDIVQSFQERQFTMNQMGVTSPEPDLDTSGPGHREPLCVIGYLDERNFHYYIAKRYKIYDIDIESLLQAKLSRHYGRAVLLEKTLVFTSELKVHEEREMQENYHEALINHSRNLEFVWGQMKRDRNKSKSMKNKKPRYVEKETDVNLACTSLNDLYIHERKILPCIITNDSDFAMLFEMMKGLSDEFLWLSPLPMETGAESALIKSSSRLKEIVPERHRDLTGIDRDLVLANRLPRE